MIDKNGKDHDRWANLWNAINEYNAACGGSTSLISDRRMSAVVGVEGALEALVQGITERLTTPIVGDASTTKSELLDRVGMILPSASLDYDNEGQIVIYTGLMDGADDRLVDLEDSEDDTEEEWVINGD